MFLTRANIYFEIALFVSLMQSRKLRDNRRQNEHPPEEPTFISKQQMHLLFYTTRTGFTAKFSSLFPHPRDPVPESISVSWPVTLWQMSRHFLWFPDHHVATDSNTSRVKRRCLYFRLLALMWDAVTFVLLQYVARLHETSPRVKLC